MLPLARYDDDGAAQFLHAAARAAAGQSGHRAIGDVFPVPVRRRQRPGRLRRSIGQPPQAARAAASAPNSIRSRRATSRPWASGCCRAATSTRPTAAKSPPVALISEVGRQGIRRQGSDRRADRSWATPIDRRRHRRRTRARRSLDAAAAGRRSICPTRSSCCPTWARSSAAIAAPARWRRRCKRRGRADRSRPADRRRQDDGADHRGVDRPAALPVVPDRELRRPRRCCSPRSGSTG